MRNDKTVDTGGGSSRSQLAEPIDQQPVRFQRTQERGTGRYSWIECPSRDRADGDSLHEHCETDSKPIEGIPGGCWGRRHIQDGVHQSERAEKFSEYHLTGRTRWARANSVGEEHRYYYRCSHSRNDLCDHIDSSLNARTLSPDPDTERPRR